MRGSAYGEDAAMQQGGLVDPVPASIDPNCLELWTLDALASSVGSLDQDQNIAIVDLRPISCRAL